MSERYTPEFCRESEANMIRAQNLTTEVWQGKLKHLIPKAAEVVVLIQTALDRCHERYPDGFAVKEETE